VSYTQFRKDIAALGVLEPTYEPRATETIPEMITIIGRLIAGGHAYAAEGHVLFAVPSMKDYGQLSRRPLDEMIAGARVDVAPYKRDAMDFVLWKPSDAETPGWESPWGRGRPGWHIECSAMSWKHLGEVFDIHGGGIDLVFPHHENELAQTRCAFGHNVMANIWMHNGFLQVEGQKMSKSLGNFVTINEALKDWPGEVMKYAMLSTHYTQPIDWTRSKLTEARRSLQKFEPWYIEPQPGFQPEFDPTVPHPDVVSALLDDLNTPEVFASLHRQVGDLSDRTTQPTPLHERRLSEFSRSLDLLGLTPRKAELTVEVGVIDSLVEGRLAARKAKNWAESDRIRDELLGMGIVLKDNKDGTTSWEVKR
jgi:cysteinyl-tRNA synthetase